MNQGTATSANIQEEELSLGDFIGIVTSRYKTVLAIFLVFTALGVLYAFLATPIYRADALIQVEEKKGTTLGALSQVLSALEVGQSPVDGEIEIVKSRSVVLAAIDSLDVNLIITPMRKVPFFARSHENKFPNGQSPLAEPKFGMSDWAWGGERIKLDDFDLPAQSLGDPFQLEIVDQNDWILYDQDNEKVAAGSIGQSIKFLVEGRAGTIKVSEIQARPGNRFKVTLLSRMQTYDNVLENMKVAETVRKSSVMRVSFEDRDVNLAVRFVNEVAKTYVEKNLERRSEETQKSIEFLDQQLPRLKAEVERAETAFNQYRIHHNLTNVDKETDAILAQAVELEKNRVLTQLKRQELALRFAAGHPALVSIDQQLQVLANESEKLEDNIRHLPDTQQEYLSLKRDVVVNTDLYTALLNNAEQLRVAKAGTISNVYVIDPAVAPYESVRPKKVLIIVGSLLGGLFVGAVTALLLHGLRPTIRRGEELERATGMPVYATVPESRDQTRMFDSKKPRADHGLLALVNPDDPAIEGLRSLRTGMQFALVGAANKSIVVTGATSGLGKSFLAANLGVVLSEINKRVVVIDCDMRRPRLDRYFGLKRSPGLSEFLAGTMNVDQVIRKDVRPNLDVLCAGEIPPNPADLLLRGRLKELLDELQGRYDYVLIDSPPVLPVADSLSVAALCATIFLTVRADQSTLGQIRETLRRLESAGIRPNGFLFNGVKTRGAGYYYYYDQYSYTRRRD